MRDDKIKKNDLKRSPDFRIWAEKVLKKRYWRTYSRKCKHKNARTWKTVGSVQKSVKQPLKYNEWHDYWEKFWQSCLSSERVGWVWGVNPSPNKIFSTIYLMHVSFWLSFNINCFKVIEKYKYNNLMLCFTFFVIDFYGKQRRHAKLLIFWWNSSFFLHNSSYAF